MQEQTLALEEILQETVEVMEARVALDLLTAVAVAALAAIVEMADKELLEVVLETVDRQLQQVVEAAAVPLDMEVLVEAVLVY
jgi:hypothetical protein